MSKPIDSWSARKQRLEAILRSEDVRPPQKVIKISGNDSVYKGQVSITVLASVVVVCNTL